jgi:hypothetical protein
MFCLSIHSSLGGYVGYFHLLSYGENVAIRMNLLLQDGMYTFREWWPESQR